MKLKKKIAAGLLALGMVSGIGVAAAAPASAATGDAGVTHYYFSKISCELGRYQIIKQAGNRTTGYGPCGYRGNNVWAFQIWYY